MSGSTLYVGSTGTMNYDGGNPGVTGFHDSNIQVRDLTASVGFGSYSSDSYKSNGVIAVSNQFSVAAGSNFSVS